MELDDFKKTLIKENKMNSNIDDFSFEEIKTKVTSFEKGTKRNLFIETLVAVFAFITVIILIINGNSIYSSVIDTLMPNIANEVAPQINLFMYLSMILMAVYCVFVIVKLHLTQKSDESLNWTLISRLDSEINKLAQQHKLWSKAHLWAVIPALVIGVLFFWGIQISLLNTWFPGLYLSLYFIFMTLASFAGIWIKNNMATKRIQPLLDQLLSVRKQLNSNDI